MANSEQPGVGKKPSGQGMRDPTSNAQQNGRVVNPPRYPQLGGFTGSGKGFKKNDKNIRRPGDTK